MTSYPIDWGRGGKPGSIHRGGNFFKAATAAQFGMWHLISSKAAGFAAVLEIELHSADDAWVWTAAASVMDLAADSGTDAAIAQFGDDRTTPIGIPQIGHSTTDEHPVTGGAGLVRALKISGASRYVFDPPIVAAFDQGYIIVQNETADTDLDISARWLVGRKTGS